MINLTLDSTGKLQRTMFDLKQLCLKDLERAKLPEETDAVSSSSLSAFCHPNGLYTNVFSHKTCPQSFFAVHTTARRKLSMNHAFLYASSKWPRAV